MIALEDELPSGAYNIRTGTETSVNRLYELMQELSGKTYLPSTVRSSPASSYVALSTTHTPLVSWAGAQKQGCPEVGLNVGLRETLRYIGVLF